MVYTRPEDPGNLWAQPVGGGPPRVLMKLPYPNASGLVWSPNGKFLAFTRGSTTSDIVMITGFAPAGLKPK